MTSPKEKDARPVVPTRTPKKKTVGIFDNLRKIPQPHPVEEMLGLVKSEPDATPSTPSRGGRGSSPSSPPHLSSAKNEIKPPLPVSPQRDFAKVANSIVREAIPSEIFGGKSKQLYDFLYSQTRGAITPQRTVRISKEKLMKGAGIGSEVTLRSNLSKLHLSGLVIERIYAGTHGGNEYEVFLPEEVETGATLSTPSTPSRGGNPLQFLEGLDPLVSRGSRGGLSSMESGISADSNTSFKTNTIDDEEPLSFFLKKIKETHRKIAGREISSQDVARWNEVADVLAEELVKAAARTEAITSVPAFLAAHLRRKFSQPGKKIDAKEKTGPPSAEVVSNTAGQIVTPARKMTDEERAEAMQMVVDLVKTGGYTLAQAETQFASSFGEENWLLIKTKIEAPDDREG